MLGCSDARELEDAEAEADDSRAERRFEKDERAAARPARIPETR
jgi:hypothetical protein